MITDGEFAARMRAARAYAGLTLIQAGEALDYSASHLSKMENADENGHQFRKRDRQAIAAVYCEMTPFTPEFFTAETVGSSSRSGRHEGDLSPAEVVNLVEDGPDGTGGAAELP
jgi:transcriptional regulator with XRE-family HTH domain